MYNKKLKKWLQPGGHIDGIELPCDTAIREVFEETGVKVKLIGLSYDGLNIEPIAVSHYKNSVGDMIDIQYLSIPLTKELINCEDNDTIWFPIRDLDSFNEIDVEIRNKVSSLYEKYKEIVN